VVFRLSFQKSSSHCIFQLYVPFQKKQQLLEQSADCIAATTLLKTLGIEFKVEERANTEWMSSNGNVPVLVEGATNRVYFGCKEIQETLKTKEIAHLNSPDDGQLEEKLVNLFGIGLFLARVRNPLLVLCFHFVCFKFGFCT